MHTRRGWLIGTAAAAVGVYALLWLGVVQNWAWLARVDAWALEPAHRLGSTHPGWITAWNVFCTVLGPNAFRLVVLVVIVVALTRRNVRIAMFLVISVELSGLVTEIAKALADRPRPATAMVTAYGTSFPSGHALGVIVAVLALLTVALPVVCTWRRGWLIALGVGVVVAIGAGRVVLNVHHPSDVIAGWSLGYAYFVACVLMVPPLRPITQSDETPAVPGSAP
ncbi:MAG: phosphatase PAP2 family protein [Mycobacterium sp.]|nr:phosphatase PAP2 family protein [Mycobacterium sp.]